MKEGSIVKKRLILITWLILFILIITACQSNNKNKNSNRSQTLQVVIDPGHGGSDVGASGASGQHEKDFTLRLSQKVGKRLEKVPQIEVFMTRTDDRFISQASRYRPKYANKLDVDLFISIHGNTYSDPNVSGTETFYYKKNSHSLAKILQKHVSEATGFRNRGTTKKELFVVKDTKMPAALIEIGHLTNPHDESQMWTNDFQNRVADAIVEGIKEYKVKLE
jgi:N-acetylmuramoyl-L-alanine amidase